MVEEKAEEEDAGKTREDRPDIVTRLEDVNQILVMSKM